MAIQVTTLALILLFSIVGAQAQKQGTIWYFGLFAGLSFKSGEPVALVDSQMETDEGCAVQSDTSGNLLFYTDGQHVWNRRHQVMPGGDRLAGHVSSTQSAVIVPLPGSATQYYIFTVDAFDNGYKGGINYSVVDLTLAGGNGDVVSVNNRLQPYTAEKITAVKDADGEGVWIIAHLMDSDSFVLWKLTATGISTAPITIKVGPVLEFGDSGYMKADPAGGRIAMASRTTKTVTLFRFDRATGAITSPVSIPMVDAYGVEFSPNGRYLYASRYSSPDVLQYDVERPDNQVVASRTLIGTTSAPICAGIQLAPNGRLYVAHYDSPTLSEITNPNTGGIGCGFRDCTVQLGGKISRYGLPNFMPTIFGNEPQYTVASRNGCAGESIPFEISGTDVTDVRWVFGDVTSGGRNTAAGARTDHIFMRPGTYQIVVTFRSLNVNRKRSAIVVIHPLPKVNAGADRTICVGQPLPLRATGAESYHWEPAALFDQPDIPNPTLRTKASVQVVVTGTSADGCIDVDTMQVSVGSLAVSVSADTTLCAGGSARLRAEGAVTYAWTPTTSLDDPSSATPTAVPAVTTTYRVVASSGECTDTAFVTVRISEGTAGMLSGDTTICKGTSARLSALGGGSYLWVPATGLDDASLASPTARPAVTTRYTVVVTNGGRCVDTASVLVTVTDSVRITAGNDTTICKGSVVRLQASGATQIVWSNTMSGERSVGGTWNVSPNVTTTYLAESADATCTVPARVTVTVQEAGPMVISRDTTVCAGVPVTLVATGAPGRIVWSPATGLSAPTSAITMASPTATTTYTCTADNAGCVASASVTVHIVPARVPVLSTHNVSVVAGDQRIIPITIGSPAEESLPGMLEVSWYGHIMDVHLSANAVSTGRSMAPDNRITETFYITAPDSAGVLAVMDTRYYVTDRLSTTVGVRYTPLLCSAMAATDVDVQVAYEQCAERMRYVAIHAGSALAVAVRPNPAFAEIVLDAQTPYVGPHTVRIADMQGRIVFERIWNVQEGDGTALTVDASLWPAGIYAVEWTATAARARTTVYKVP